MLNVKHIVIKTQRNYKHHHHHSTTDNFDSTEFGSSVETTITEEFVRSTHNIFFDKNFCSFSRKTCARVRVCVGRRTNKWNTKLNQRKRQGRITFEIEKKKKTWKSEHFRSKNWNLGQYDGDHNPTARPQYRAEMPNMCDGLQNCQRRCSDFQDRSTFG